jgi:acyl carrier protein
LYKTGDLVRFREDGQLVFAGRADTQIKLRGFRIELGEIEALLSRCPGVREAAVVLADAPGGGRLVAYVVPTSDDRQPTDKRPIPPHENAPPSSRHPVTLSSCHLVTLVPAELRAYLAARLPGYMVPAAYIPLDALPLTHTGKVDRRALAQLARAQPVQSQPTAPPTTPTERALADIWARVLGQAQIGIHDNFFDLGGHSLLATEVAAAIRDTFEIELPLRSLFEAPTIAQQAPLIEQAVASRAGVRKPAIVPLNRSAYRKK